MNNQIGSRGSFNFSVDEKYNDYEYEICEFKGALSGDSYGDDYDKNESYSTYSAGLNFSKSNIRIQSSQRNDSSGARPSFNISRNKNIFTVQVGLALRNSYSDREFHFKFIFYKRE